MYVTNLVFTKMCNRQNYNDESIKQNPEWISSMLFIERIDSLSPLAAFPFPSKKQILLVLYSQELIKVCK